MSERVKEGVINTLAVLTVIFVIGLILLGIYAFSSHHDNSNSKQIDHNQSRKSSPSGITNPSSRHYDSGDTDESEDNDNNNDYNDVYYANCSEARANGAESIREGEPGYREELDRDGDGIACEPWHGR